MELTIARNIAREAMNQYDLETWNFGFDKALRRFGVCDHGTKTITLSKKLVELNEEFTVMKVIYHEVAHAIVGPGNGHNTKWKRTCLGIGGDGRRCYNPKVVNTVDRPYEYFCKGCGKIFKYFRKPKKQRSCGFCCDTFNPEYIIQPVQHSFTNNQ